MERSIDLPSPVPRTRSARQHDVVITPRPLPDFTETRQHLVDGLQPWGMFSQLRHNAWPDVDGSHQRPLTLRSITTCSQLPVIDWLGIPRLALYFGSLSVKTIKTNRAFPRNTPSSQPREEITCSLTSAALPRLGGVLLTRMDPRSKARPVPSTTMNRVRVARISFCVRADSCINDGTP